MSDLPELNAAIARAEKAEAEVAETRKWVDEIVRERLDEINAEGEAFDKASTNCLRNILRNLCGEAGEETINHPDGWNDDFAYECVAEEFRRRDRMIETLRADASALRIALAALAEDGRTARWQNAPHDLLRAARAALSKAEGGSHG